MTTDFRALCYELHAALERHNLSLADEQLLDRSAVALLAAMSQPEPEGPTEQEWDALVESAWDKYRTVGYQGERFIYEGDFDTALGFVREELARWGNHPGSPDSSPQPVPVSERLPGPEECLDEGWAWFFNPRTGWRQATQPVHSTYTHWLPAHALPVPNNTSRSI